MVSIEGLIDGFTDHPLPGTAGAGRFVDRGGRRFVGGSEAGVISLEFVGQAAICPECGAACPPAGIVPRAAAGGGRPAEEYVRPGREYQAVLSHHPGDLDHFRAFEKDVALYQQLFDGAGYGTDGAMWGGEFLTGDQAAFRRAARLRYVGLPGATRR